MVLNIYLSFLRVKLYNLNRERRAIKKNIEKIFPISFHNYDIKKQHSIT